MNTITETKSLKTLCQKIKIENRYGAKLAWDQQSLWQRKSNGWHCTLRYQGRQFSFDFWQGSMLSGEPTANGTLECLLSDSQSGEQTFEDFCEELGYDPDSRSAEKTWKACQDMSKGVKRLLGSDYETFLYAERD